MRCCVWLVYSHDTAPIAPVSNQTYITYQMTASIIEARSEYSLLSIRYLTLYKGLAKGPAAVYKSECTCICISVCREAKGSGPAAALGNYSVYVYVELISKCKKV